MAADGVEAELEASFRLYLRGSLEVLDRLYLTTSDSGRPIKGNPLRPGNQPRGGEISHRDFPLIKRGDLIATGLDPLS